MDTKPSRVSWKDYFMGIAVSVSGRSTCLRRKVGAVAVADARILATGYNGAPSGVPHCLDVGCMREQRGIPSGEKHELCMAGETQVKLLNGTYESLESLAEKGEDFWTYACDASGNLVPAKATQPRLTGNRTDLVKVTLDNESSFSCTKDHKIMLRNGDFEEAGNLEAGTSLMPMFFNYAHNDKYESVSNTVRCRVEGHQKKEYLGKTPSTPTHVLVYSHFWGKIPKGMEVHHKNHNHLDNTPANLELLEKGQHVRHHRDGVCRIPEKSQKIGREKAVARIKSDPVISAQFKERGKQTLTALWKSSAFREKMKKVGSSNGTKTCRKLNSDPETIKARMRGKILKGISLLSFLSKRKLTAESYDSVRQDFPAAKKRLGEKGSSFPTIKTILKYFPSMEEALDAASEYNHKVVSVVPMEGKHTVYDVSVPGYENFAVRAGEDSCVFAHNCMAVHAEQNLIIQAALHGISLHQADVYCTHKPCFICAKMLVNVGIKTIITAHVYPDPNTDQLFHDAGVRLLYI